MRTKNSVLSIGALLTIAGCAGSAPKESEAGPKPEELATYAGGRVTVDDWSSWKKTSQMPTTVSRDEESRQFSDYVKFRLDSLAARDAGLTKDTNLVRRWNSIRQRIVAERYRLDILSEQFGIDDSAVNRHLSAHPELGTSDSARIKAARAIALQGIKIDSVYQARKESFKVDSVNYRPLDSVRASLENSILMELTEGLTREFPDRARKLYKIEYVTPKRPDAPADSLKAIYEAVKSTRFRAAAVFHMHALGAKDSAPLAKALAKVKDEAAFKALAAKFPVGAPVRAPGGDLGRVKRQFSLPYGIGLAPQLFNELEPARTGLVQPMKINDQWIAFWVSAVDSGAVKSFDEVKAELAGEYEQAHPWTPSANTVMCTWDRGPLFRQSDIDFIYQEVPPHVRRQYSPQRLMEFMSLWAVVSRASEESGHMSRPATQRAILDNERIYWAQEWRKSNDYQIFGLSKGRTDSALAAAKPLFAGKDFWLDTAGVNRDGARLAIMPAGFLQSRYAENIDQYRKDSVFSTFDSSKTDVFRDARSDLDKMGQAWLDSVQKARYALKLAPAAPGEGVRQSPAVRLDTARALHDRRALDDAQRMYESVESDASAADSLRAQALFQLGQLFGEQQAYPRSLSRYRAVLARFPKSSEAYKAQFMIAFTYSEYLKLEKVALPEYRKVLTNHPKCDLADDADWMIRNIESGGALMPKFDDLDSTAKDSAKPAQAAAPEATKAATADTAKASAPKSPKADPAAKAHASEIALKGAQAAAAKAATPAAASKAPAKAVVDTSKNKPASKPAAKVEVKK